MEESGIKVTSISLIMVFAFIIISIFASAEVDETAAFAGSPCKICNTEPRDLGAVGYSGGSEIWAIDSCGAQKFDISVPLGASAEVEIAPGFSSYATLYHRLPSGSLQAEYLGYLHKGHSYRLGICPLAAGTHEMWYRTGWQESNRITMYAGV